MGKINIEFSWNNQDKELELLLGHNKLTHLKKHDGNCLKVGDALRSEKGVIVRVVEKFNNYENLSHDFILANKNVSSEELEKQFLGIQREVDYFNKPDHLHYGIDRNGNEGYFEDFEQSIGE
jgi:hypothetical protein